MLVAGDPGVSDVVPLPNSAPPASIFFNSGFCQTFFDTSYPLEACLVSLSYHVGRQFAKFENDFLLQAVRAPIFCKTSN